MLRKIISVVFIALLVGCLGDQSKNFTSPLDPKSTTYAKANVKSLAETNGVIADFESRDTTSTLGTFIAGYGPVGSDANGTVSVLSMENPGPQESAIGFMRITATYGSGVNNYGGAYISLRDGLGKAISLRGYQGVSFLVRGDAGNLDIKLENDLVTDYNYPAVVLSQIPTSGWQRVYLDFSASYWQCFLSAGCKTLSQTMDSIVAITFEIDGFANEKRAVDIDMVQLVPVGGAVPADAHTPLDFQFATYVKNHNNGLLDDFARASGSFSKLTGIRMLPVAWDTNPKPTIGIDSSAPMSGLPTSAYMDFSFPANSGVNLQFGLENSYQGTDISAAKGIQFYARSTTNAPISTLLLFSYKGQADFNNPGYAFTIGSNWPDAPTQIYFNQVSTCNYGSGCTVTAASVLNRVQDLVIEIKGTQATQGRFEIDNLQLIF